MPTDAQKVYDFNTVLPRRGTDSIKWDFPGRFFKGVPDDALMFWVADMDFPVADPILDAMRARLEHPAFGYTIHSTTRYREAVSRWYGRRFGWDVSHEEILFSPGIVKAIAFAIRAYTLPGDQVLIQRPVYAPFFATVRENGREVVNSPLHLSEGVWSIDFDDFEAKASDPRTKLFLLCSPHNPTGRVFSKAELQRMAAICSAHDVTIFSDEIHMDLLRRGERHLPLTLAAPDAIPNALVAVAPSKTFNIPGLQISNIIIPDPTVRAMFQKELDALHLFGGNIMGGVAARAAYEEGHVWLDQLLPYLDANLDWFTSRLAEALPQVVVHRPQGTYLAWIDFRALGLSTEALHERLVTRAHVVLSPGTMFGPEGEGFMRLNFATPRPLLKEGVGRLIAALGG